MNFYPKFVCPLSLGKISQDLQSSTVTLRLKGVTQDVRHLLRKSTA